MSKYEQTSKAIEQVNNAFLDVHKKDMLSLYHLALMGDITLDDLEDIANKRGYSVADEYRTLFEDLIDEDEDD